MHDEDRQVMDGEQEMSEAEELRELYGRKPYDAYANAVDALGQEAADYARHLAEASFAEFKRGMRDVGYPTLFADEPEGIGRYCISAYFHKMPRLANAALCMRYPFLVPRSRWTGDVVWYDEIDGALYDETKVEVGGRTEAFATTELDALPLGWQARFGLEICEDVRTILARSSVDGALGLYRIDQLKEKFGSLRWYSGGVPRDAYDDELHLIDLYEVISTRICINCGGLERVRGTRGWIAYECLGCRRRGMVPSGDAVIARYNALVEAGGLPDLVAAQSDAWKERHEAGKILAGDFKVAERLWEVPYSVRSLVEADILDEVSYAVGSVRDDSVSVVYHYGKGDDGPVREETDLFAWATGLGLHAMDVALDVDAGREMFDGVSNLPKDEDGEAGAE